VCISFYSLLIHRKNSCYLAYVLIFVVVMGDQLFLIFRSYDDVSSFLFSIIIIISKYNSLKIVEPNVN